MVKIGIVFLLVTFIVAGWIFWWRGASATDKSRLINAVRFSLLTASVATILLTLIVLVF